MATNGGRQRKCPLAGTPPLAKGWPIFGLLYAFYKDIISAFTDIRARHGNFAEFRWPMTKAYLLGNPETVRNMLRDGETLRDPNLTHARYEKGRYTDMMRSAFGNGLLTARGEDWAKQRAYLQPMFTSSAIETWTPLVLEETQSIHQSWLAKGDGKVVDVDAVGESHTLIQNIMGRVFFGRALPSKQIAQGVRAVSLINEQIFQHMFREAVFRGPLRVFKGLGNRPHAAAINIFADTVKAAIDASGEGDHIIARLRAAFDEDGERLFDDNDIRDQVATLFFAGQETTGSAFAWSLHHLSQRPDIVDSIAQEYTQATAHGADPSLNDLPITHAAIREVLRLSPPVYALERTPRQDLEVEGFGVKAGSLLVLSTYLCHHNDEYWAEPDKFKPERFLGVSDNDSMAKAFIPFGAGGRICIGQHLAMMELRVAIGLTCSRFHFTSLNYENVVPLARATMRPSPQVAIRLSARVN